MDAKILSFIVPAYNSEKYIDKCLSSFLCDDILGLIEVIVVNDGSNDSTARIAGEFVDKYPGSFVLINKENGGGRGRSRKAVFSRLIQPPCLFLLCFIVCIGNFLCTMQKVGKQVLSVTINSINVNSNKEEESCRSTQ